MQAGGSGQAATGFDLSGLSGRPLDVAAQEIAQRLAPDNADADRIAGAMQEALAEALPDQSVFDPTAMSPDQIIAVLVQFMSLILFNQVVEDAASAWNKAPDAERTVEAEGELLELIKAAVDKHLAPKLANGAGTLAKADVQRLQREAMEEVWREWEAYQ
jgi:hypothetical protein